MSPPVDKNWGMGLSPDPRRNCQERGDQPAPARRAFLPHPLRPAGDGATAHLETGGFIRSQPGIPHPDIQFHFLPSQVIDHGRVPTQQEAFQVSSHPPSRRTAFSPLHRAFRWGARSQGPALSCSGGPSGLGSGTGISLG